MYALKGC